jgi:Tat protein translocase TatB subunit
MSFGELTVVIIVALVVMGPKELPKVLRKMGQWAGKLRRMAADLRAQSGIDDALRTEGLDVDIGEIRKLARGELDGVVRADIAKAATASAAAMRPPERPPQESPIGVFSEMFVQRDRENPIEGPDSYGALPDTAIVYDGSLPRSQLADDPLYMTGDPTVPDRPPPAPEKPEEKPTQGVEGK